MDEKEKYWIEFYKTTNDNNGYNIMSGGQGGKGTKEVIEKQRKSQEKNKKKVYAFNSNGELCLSWDSIKECSKDLLVSTLKHLPHTVNWMFGIKSSCQINV